MADVAGAARTGSSPRCAARIKEDDSSVPSPDGPYAYGIRFAHGAEHPMLIRTRPRRRRRDRAPRRQCDGRGQGLFPSRRQRPQPGPPAARLCQRREGLGVFRDPHPRSRDRRGPARPHRRHLRRAGLGGGFAHAPLRLARRQPSPGEGLPPRRRHRPVGGRGGLRGRATRPIFLGVGKTQSDRSSSSTATTTRRRRCASSTADDPAGDAAPRRAAAAGGEVRGRRRRRRSSTSSPTPATPRTSRSSPRRWRPRAASTGATSCRTSRAG